ncbi:hypothetical protein B0H12DRAFT_1072267 [Mycena haematopus]|nr:hypothetical protein B0H12DRAFT_1072267 [Mycena haematopus]
MMESDSLSIVCPRRSVPGSRATVPLVYLSLLARKKRPTCCARLPAILRSDLGMLRGRGASEAASGASGIGPRAQNGERGIVARVLGHADSTSGAQKSTKIFVSHRVTEPILALTEDAEQCRRIKFPKGDRLRKVHIKHRACFLQDEDEIENDESNPPVQRRGSAHQTDPIAHRTSHRARSALRLSRTVEENRQQARVIHARSESTASPKCHRTGTSPAPCGAKTCKQTATGNEDSGMCQSRVPLNLPLSTSSVHGPPHNPLRSLPLSSKEKTPPSPLTKKISPNTKPRVNRPKRTSPENPRIAEEHLLHAWVERDAPHELSVRTSEQRQELWEAEEDLRGALGGCVGGREGEQKWECIMSKVAWNMTQVFDAVKCCVKGAVHVRSHPYPPRRRLRAAWGRRGIELGVRRAWWSRIRWNTAIRVCSSKSVRERY